MRVTIIRDNDTVNVDGVAYTVDCSKLPADFHALQWNGTSGEIEYRMVVCAHCNTRSKKPNLFINDMTPYQPYVDAWGVAKAAALAAATEQAAALEQAKAANAVAFDAAVTAAVREHMDNAARSQG